MSKTLDLGAVTAYALAVKNGFTGTEAEWLESLVKDNAVQVAIADTGGYFSGSTVEAALQELGPQKAGSSFTTAEVDTGRTWIDGKEIYRKVVQTAYVAPSSGYYNTVEVSLPDLGIDKTISNWTYAISGHICQHEGIPFYLTGNVQTTYGLYSIVTEKGNGDKTPMLKLMFGTALYTYTFYTVLEYTKA